MKKEMSLTGLIRLVPVCPRIGHLTVSDKVVSPRPYPVKLGNIPDAPYYEPVHQVVFLLGPWAHPYAYAAACAYLIPVL